MTAKSRLAVKAVAIVTALAAAAALLAGCGSGGNEANSAPPPATTTQSESAETTPPAEEIDVVHRPIDERFLKEIRAEIPWLSGATDERVLDLAYEVAASYATDGPGLLTDLVDTLTADATFSARQAVTFIKVAVFTFGTFEARMMFMADLDRYQGA